MSMQQLLRSAKKSNVASRTGESHLKRIYAEYAEDIKIYDEDHRKNASASIGICKAQRERQDAVNAARANSKLSGFEVSEAVERYSARYVADEISLDEFLSLRRK